MKFIKTKIFIAFMLMTAATTFYYFGDSTKLLNTSLDTIKETPLQPLVSKFIKTDSGLNVENYSEEKQENKTTDKKLEKVNSVGREATLGYINLQNTITNAQTELSTLSSRTQEVKEHAENILGTAQILGSSIEATQDATPFHEKAFEYGKYVYCQQVVADYENFNQIE